MSGTAPAVSTRGLGKRYLACGLRPAACGLRPIITFQPAGRYWLFQGMEAALYLLLAALLITASLSYLRRMDG